MTKLPTGTESRVILVKIESTSDSDPATAVEQLRSQHGISKIDTVIANSGIAKYYGPAFSTPISELREHIEINSVAPLILFQAVWPLLEQSATPKFVVVSSPLASIGDMEKVPMPTAAYGSSKAMVNYLVRKIHFEHEKLIAFVINPG